MAAAIKDTDSGADTSIRDANKLKSFLTYKHLLEIHHIQKGKQIDLFNLLVNGVLKHFRYTLTNGKELGELWQTVETLIAKTTDISYNLTQKKKDVNAALKTFNDAFSELFKTDKAAAVYTRSAFEKILRKYCEDKKKKTTFKSKLKD